MHVPERVLISSLEYFCFPEVPIYSEFKPSECFIFVWCGCYSQLLSHYPPSPQVQPHNVPQQFVLNKLAKNQPAFFVFISTSTILIMCDDTTLIVSRGRQNHKQHVSRWKLWTTGSRMFLCGIKAKHGNGSKKYCMLYEYHILLPKIRFFFLSKPNIKCVIHIKNKVQFVCSGSILFIFQSFLLPHQKGNTKSCHQVNFKIIYSRGFCMF